MSYQAPRRPAAAPGHVAPDFGCGWSAASYLLRLATESEAAHPRPQTRPETRPDSGDRAPAKRDDARG